MSYFNSIGEDTDHGSNAKMPKAVTMEDKTANEKVQLIAQLEEEDKHAVYRIIDGMLTKNKFQNFVEQHMVAK